MQLRERQSCPSLFYNYYPLTTFFSRFLAVITCYNLTRSWVLFSHLLHTWYNTKKLPHMYVLDIVEINRRYFWHGICKDEIVVCIVLAVTNNDTFILRNIES